MTKVFHMWTKRHTIHLPHYTLHYTNQCNTTNISYYITILCPTWHSNKITAVTLVVSRLHKLFMTSTHFETLSYYQMKLANTFTLRLWWVYMYLPTHSNYSWCVSFGVIFLSLGVYCILLNLKQTGRITILWELNNQRSHHADQGVF